MMRAVSVALLVCVITLNVCAQPTADKITSLPGLNASITFDQYAGYLTVDAANGRKLFYWFVESQNDPSTDPIVLWLNGGPGCSSLIGLLSENGPFRPSDDGQDLFLNPYSWNKIANMLYLEAPAGVGFSYSNNPNDYNTGDARTARDNYVAIVQWFKKFPAYMKREFYIAGESYGGHYVPTLAEQIHEGNKNVKNTFINLQGIVVGNGLTVNDIDLNSPIAVWAYHALFPISIYSEMEKQCQGNYITNNNPACVSLMNQVQSMLGNIDPYDIYAPVCQQQQLPKGKKGYSPVHFEHPLLEKIPFDPCIDLHLTDYLNRNEVRAAIHADAAAGEWVECTDKINYNFTMANGQSMIPIYKKFFAEANYNILIYSGDVDSVVPFLGTEQWINTLNLKVVEEWRSWEQPSKQVGGYVRKYDKLTLLTIRGAGHMVPYFKPSHAFTFFSRYMSGQPF